MESGNDKYALFKERVKKKKEAKELEKLEDDYTFNYFDNLVEHDCININDLMEATK